MLFGFLPNMTVWIMIIIFMINIFALVCPKDIVPEVGFAQMKQRDFLHKTLLHQLHLFSVFSYFTAMNLQFNTATIFITFRSWTSSLYMIFVGISIALSVEFVEQGWPTSAGGSADTVLQIQSHKEPPGFILCTVAMHLQSTSTSTPTFMLCLVWQKDLLCFIPTLFCASVCCCSLLWFVCRQAQG